MIQQQLTERRAEAAHERLRDRRVLPCRAPILALLCPNRSYGRLQEPETLSTSSARVPTTVTEE
jgi:hypothetical protein